MTVDGGTNKWYSFVKQNAFDDLKFPDLITGDLDSADPIVVERFVSMGSKIVHTPNQDDTDFTKALREVKKYSTSNLNVKFFRIFAVFLSFFFFFFCCLEHNKCIQSVIVMVNMCHRIDHFLSNINTLYKLKPKDHSKNEDIYLLGRNSLTWLLQAGTHSIHIPQSLRLHPEKNYVGFFPLGSKCKACTTTGLKWNICESCSLLLLLLLL